MLNAFEYIDKLLIEIIFNQNDYNWNGNKSSWDLIYEYGQSIPNEFDNLIAKLKEEMDNSDINARNISDIDSIRFDFNNKELYISLDCEWEIKYTQYIYNDEYDEEDEDSDEDERYKEEKIKKFLNGRICCFFDEDGNLKEINGHYFKSDDDNTVTEEQFEVWPNDNEPIYKPTQKEKYPEM